MSQELITKKEYWREDVFCGLFEDFTYCDEDEFQKKLADPLEYAVFFEEWAREQAQDLAQASPPCLSLYEIARIALDAVALAVKYRERTEFVVELEEFSGKKTHRLVKDYQDWLLSVPVTPGVANVLVLDDENL